MMNGIIQYLIEWLCYGNSEAAARVAYTADEKALETHDVIIVPNGHLGKDIIVPFDGTSTIGRFNSGR